MATARRLPPAERREQLLDAALAIAAEEGMEATTFDAVAARADVTRNLVYHYFPSRPDLLRAAAERAGEDLTRDWVTDESIPLPERLAANFNRLIDHAAEPSSAWLLHRQGRASGDQEIRDIAARYLDTVIANVSLNQLGTTDPPPLVRIALEGYVAYAETVLDAWRESDVSREEITVLLTRTLAATIEAAAG